MCSKSKQVIYSIVMSLVLTIVASDPVALSLFVLIRNIGLGFFAVDVRM